MSLADLTKTLQLEMRPLIESIFEELRRNPGTSHYHKIDSDELLRRGEAVYHNLLDWLMHRDQGALRNSGIELGRARFAEGIPLGQVVLAVLLEEKHIWSHPATQQFASDSELTDVVTEFFKSFIYWTARGFAAELESDRPTTGRVIPPPPRLMPTTKADREQPLDELISRGGQIAEFGG